MSTTGALPLTTQAWLAHIGFGVCLLVTRCTSPKRWRHFLLTFDD